jgi:hypothetical protein
MKVVGLCQHTPIKTEVFSHTIEAARQPGLPLGTEIDDKTLKSQEILLP